ncbi:uncharacterized protein L969DRAFT_16206 [Mixia osmundae IAM 14324]|uniref:Uncharacterized protein n=1 Tax=Mixia osmundae (strain CBS 9802 / IAM 14324 / JCM 22182 / KY 12970) TaxID=764103 RepID=G7E590_MIXOS|nr:uncharacterized protein L969DRAFT_16206 [Mixia osmundae IAM 14324]KEI40850.1 hypothetical protein L969DRAFT_16206 [Mixia osmundae IAM 14324]GAA98000.1 hypothetical protein E5Q_04680 [Mixia osmundae IAM 14324]
MTDIADEADMQGVAPHDVMKLYANKYASDLATTRRVGRSLHKSELYQYQKLLKHKVVVITGAGSGFGRNVALASARNGAKVVMGDVNKAGLQAVADEIKLAGGKVVHTVCNVTSWQSQVDLFKLAERTYGKVDIVFANAGVTEKLHPGFEDDVIGADGELTKPDLRTLDINLIGVLYTVKLAVYHLRKHRDAGRAIILLSSMAGFHGVPMAPMYSTSKWGVRGLLQSLTFLGAAEGFRVNSIHPWFASTGIIEPLTRLGLVGLPLCDLEDVNGALIRAATCPNIHGRMLIVDPKGVLEITTDETEDTIYAEFGRRAYMTLALGATVRDISYVLRLAIGKNKLKILSLIAAILGLVQFRRSRV